MLLRVAPCAPHVLLRAAMRFLVWLRYAAVGMPPERPAELPVCSPYGIDPLIKYWDFWALGFIKTDKMPWRKKPALVHTGMSITNRQPTTRVFRTAGGYT